MLSRCFSIHHEVGNACYKRVRKMDLRFQTLQAATSVSFQSSVSIDFQLEIVSAECLGFLIFAVLLVCFFRAWIRKTQVDRVRICKFYNYYCFVLFIAPGLAKITSSKTECVFLGAWCTRTIWISAERESFVRPDLPHLERYTLLLGFQVFIDPCKLMHTVNS